METFAIKNLTFTYPGQKKPALQNISIDIEAGEFVVICGQSGSGKSTLLRNLKPILAPHGVKEGQIVFDGQPLETLSRYQQASKIGYVLQNPDNQIVTDKVWHELAFGLENLGMDTKTIRLRVAEMASFFGIQTWFHKDVNELSGGQKQLLNLAAVMAMQPEVLILDEPTSQLDPIASGEFLETVHKINQELGTTVILTEHRLEDVVPVADRVVVLEKGNLVTEGTPANVGKILAQKNHPMFMAMPTPLQVYSLLYQDGIGCELSCPVNVREGRKWLTTLFEGKTLRKTVLPTMKGEPKGNPIVEMKEVWFRYHRQEPDVIKDLSFKVYPGELFCLVGGNGTGKTTTLKLASGVKKPYRGQVKLKGKELDGYKKKELFKGLIGVLPQNPQSIFVEKTVRLDLMEVFEGQKINREEKNQKIEEIAQIVEIHHLLDMHPYDLSGGEQQRAALAKVLLLNPEVLFLDEPTKGLDNSFKFKLAGILKSLLNRGITIIMVSHDIEFCGKYGDRCAMFFDGKIITSNTPREFFSGNSFYTTAANRMSRHLFENAVNVDDIVELVRENWNAQEAQPLISDDHDGNDDHDSNNDNDNDNNSAEIHEKKRVPKWLLDISMLLLAALTIWVGFYVFENKQYGLVCVLLVLYSMVPFFVSFEQRRPKAREIVLLAVMVAAAAVGRAAFFMIPNFKPILAIIIIAGAALGKDAGFLIGAMSAFVSNFLFGQGPWTPWQMIAMAVIGYLAGFIFHKYAEKKPRIPMMIFGGISVFVLYGAIVDLWTILIMAAGQQITLHTILTVYGAAVYFNLVHAVATVIFIFLLAKPIMEKLNRVKIKYGMNVYSG